MKRLVVVSSVKRSERVDGGQFGRCIFIHALPWKTGKLCICIDVLRLVLHLRSSSLFVSIVRFLRFMTKFFFLAAWVVLTAQPSVAQTEYSEALAEIRLTAESICQSVPIEGSSSSVSLTGRANAQLEGLLRRLAELGIDGNAEFQEENFTGVLRDQLADAIGSANECRLSVFETLVDAILRPSNNDRASTTSFENTESASIDHEQTLKLLQGDWYSARFRYGFNIVDDKGFATVTNAPHAFAVGDQILRIDGLGNGTASGSQVFTNGAWYDVSIRVSEDGTIEMKGGAWTWTMCRPDWEKLSTAPCLPQNTIPK